MSTVAVSAVAVSATARKSFLITLENDITETEFTDHYVSAIRKANAAVPGCEFVTRSSWPPLHAGMRKLGIDPCKVLVILAGGQQFANPHGSKILRFQSCESAKQFAVARTHADIYWKRTAARSAATHNVAPRNVISATACTIASTPPIRANADANAGANAAPRARISNITRHPAAPAVAVVDAAANAAANAVVNATAHSEITDILKRRAKKNAAARA